MATKAKGDSMMDVLPKVVDSLPDNPAVADFVLVRSTGEMFVYDGSEWVRCPAFKVKEPVEAMQ